MQNCSHFSHISTIFCMTSEKLVVRWMCDKKYIGINITYLCHFLSQLIILRNDQISDIVKNQEHQTTFYPYLLYNPYNLHNLQVNNTQYTACSDPRWRPGLLSSYWQVLRVQLPTHHHQLRRLTVAQVTRLSQHNVIIANQGLSLMERYNITGSELCTNSFQTPSKAFHLSPSVNLRLAAQRIISVSLHNISSYLII